MTTTGVQEPPHPHAHVHFPEADVRGHENKIQVETTATGYEIHLGVLQHQHEYEARVVLPRDVGLDTCASSDDGALTVMSCTPVDGGTSMRLRLVARHILSNVETVTIAEGVVLTAVYKVLKPGQGTPLLLDEVHCVAGAPIPPVDSE